MIWAVAIASLIAAYLLGATPTGYLVARTLKGIDIREHGSGNPGATNVFRTVGKGAGITVLIVDLLKGFLSVILARLAITYTVSTLGQTDIALTDNISEATTVIAQLFQGPAIIAWVTTLAGLGAIIGHSRSLWLNFTGGKSAATGLGVLLALSWPVGLGVAGVFGSVFAISRIVSLGSITAAVAAPLLMGLTQQPLPFFLLALAAGLYVVLRHRSNINRLLAGQEPRLDTK